MLAATSDRIPLFVALAARAGIPAYRDAAANVERLEEIGLPE